MKDSQGQLLRRQLLDLLKGGGAHVQFDDVVGNVPVRVRGQKPKGMPHSPWMLLEHMRMAQRDILEFSRNRNHVSPDWPAGYWPKTDAPPGPSAWAGSIKRFHKDLKAMQVLVANPKTDLFVPIAWGDGQTILREALLVADHNAYHVGQLVDVLRLLGVWKG